MISVARCLLLLGCVVFRCSLIILSCIRWVRCYAFCCCLFGFNVCCIVCVWCCRVCCVCWMSFLYDYGRCDCFVMLMVCACLLLSFYMLLYCLMCCFFTCVFVWCYVCACFVFFVCLTYCIGINNVCCVYCVCFLNCGLSCLCCSCLWIVFYLLLLSL